MEVHPFLSPKWRFIPSQALNGHSSPPKPWMEVHPFLSHEWRFIGFWALNGGSPLPKPWMKVHLFPSSAWKFKGKSMSMPFLVKMEKSHTPLGHDVSVSCANFPQLKPASLLDPSAPIRTDLQVQVAINKPVKTLRHISSHASMTSLLPLTSTVT